MARRKKKPPTMPKCDWPTKETFRAELDGVVAEVIHGNSYDIVETMAPGQFDAVVTDPPYNVLPKGTAKWDQQQLDMQRMMKCIYHALKKDGVAVIFCGSNQLSYLEEYAKESGFDYAVEGIWLQHDPFQGMWGVTKSHESFLIAWFKGTEKLHLRYGAPRNVVASNIVNTDEQVKKDDSGRNNNRLHQCQKPAGVITKILNAYVAENGRVLDMFAGSSAILRVALLNGNDCVGIEKEKHFFERGTLAFSDEKIMRTCHGFHQEATLSTGRNMLHEIGLVLEKDSGLSCKARTFLMSKISAIKGFALNRSMVSAGIFVGAAWILSLLFESVIKTQPY